MNAIIETLGNMFLIAMALLVALMAIGVCLIIIGWIFRVAIDIYKKAMEELGE